MLARVVGDEETGGGFQFLGGFRDVAQLEVGDFAGEREIARAVEQAAVVAVATPRQNQRGDFDDLVAFARRIGSSIINSCNIRCVGNSSGVK